MNRRFGASRVVLAPAADHASLGDFSTGQHHSIFLNPSISEVLCTATAEALAMGKVCHCAMVHSVDAVQVMSFLHF